MNSKFPQADRVDNFGVKNNIRWILLLSVAARAKTQIPSTYFVHIFNALLLIGSSILDVKLLRHHPTVVTN